MIIFGEFFLVQRRKSDKATSFVLKQEDIHFHLILKLQNTRKNCFFSDRAGAEKIYIIIENLLDVTICNMYIVYRIIVRIKLLI